MQSSGGCDADTSEEGAQYIVRSAEDTARRARNRESQRAYSKIFPFPRSPFPHAYDLDVGKSVKKRLEENVELRRRVVELEWQLESSITTNRNSEQRRQENSEVMANQILSEIDISRLPYRNVVEPLVGLSPHSTAGLISEHPNQSDESIPTASELHDSFSAHTADKNSLHVVKDLDEMSLSENSIATNEGRTPWSTGWSTAPLNHATTNAGTTENMAQRRTAIMDAVECGNVQMLGILLDGGADPEVKDSFGSTPLHTACRLGHYEAVAMILHHCTSRALNERDSCGFTPLHIAVMHNHAEIAQLLVKNGVNVNLSS